MTIPLYGVLVQKQHWQEIPLLHLPYALLPSAAQVDPRDKIEGEFIKVLDRLTPSTQLFGLVAALFKKAWDESSTAVANFIRGCEREAAKLQNADRWVS